jgi:competence protein ComEA
MEKWLERYRWVLLGLVAAAVAGVVLFQLLRPQSPPIILSTPTSLPTPEVTPTPHPLRVYVSGAVQRPDVYTLAPDSIVKDAILAAGGATEEADLDHINLAMPIADGQHVYIPRFGEESLPVQMPSGQRVTGGRINVNTADLAALESLPGIGPVMAQRILDYRQDYGPFARPEDVMNVSGVGPATFEGIRDLITTE